MSSERRWGVRVVVQKHLCVFVLCCSHETAGPYIFEDDPLLPPLYSPLKSHDLLGNHTQHLQEGERQKAVCEREWVRGVFDQTWKREIQIIPFIFGIEPAAVKNDRHLIWTVLE